MKLKLVRHRLRPVIGFERPQLRLPRAEPDAGHCPAVSGPLSPARATRHNLRTWKAKKETCFLPAPHTYQLASRTRRDACVGKVAKWCWSRWSADGEEGNTFYHRK